MKALCDPVLKMPSTQRRKEAKAQSIFVIMGVRPHEQLMGRLQSGKVAEGQG
jgi:hypothetical protein